MVKKEKKVEKKVEDTPEKYPNIELIIVNWNTSEVIKESVRSLIEYTDYPGYFHLTIMDNSSLDDSWKTIQELCFAYEGRVDGYQNHVNKGYGRALNYGAALSGVEGNPDYYCFLNSDIFVDGNHVQWLRALVDTFQEDESEIIGIAAPKLLSPTGLVNGHAVKGTDYENDLSWYWNQPDDGRFDDLEDAITLCGACLLIPKDLFWKMGGFDPHLRHFYEEKLLIYKIRREGYRAVCNPESVLIHIHMASENDKNLLSCYEHYGREYFEHYFNTIEPGWLNFKEKQHVNDTREEGGVVE
jgi:GT2 family glycosyltransferase